MFRTFFFSFWNIEIATCCPYLYGDAGIVGLPVSHYEHHVGHVEPVTLSLGEGHLSDKAESETRVSPSMGVPEERGENRGICVYNDLQDWPQRIKETSGQSGEPAPSWFVRGCTWGKRGEVRIKSHV